MLKITVSVLRKVRSKAYLTCSGSQKMRRASVLTRTDKESDSLSANRYVRVLVEIFKCILSLTLVQFSSSLWKHRLKAQFSRVIVSSWRAIMKRENHQYSTSLGQLNRMKPTPGAPRKIYFLVKPRLILPLSSKNSRPSLRSKRHWPLLKSTRAPKKIKDCCTRN